jgi:AbrB family looped-hinge helix DNA binding protein
MRTTIDNAGRIVIPKRIRNEAGLAPGTEVEVELYDGRVEIEPVSDVRFRLVNRDGRAWIEADRELPTLTDEQVRETLERVRDRR